MALDPTSIPITAQWKARLKQREQWLGARPEDVGAPYWRIQVKILRYLLARHGADLTLKQPSAPRPAAHALKHGGSSRFARQHVRSGREIRPFLVRIAEANRRVRVD